MSLAQIESMYKLKNIASNPRERHEERTERKRGGKRTEKDAFRLREWCSKQPSHTAGRAEKGKEKLSNASGKEDFEDLQPNDQREYISHAEQAVFHLRHEILHFF